MQVEYLDVTVRRLATSEVAVPGWTDVEVACLRRLVQCLHAAETVNDVRSLRQLRLQAVTDPTAACVWLSAARLLKVMFKTDGPFVTAMLDIDQIREDARSHE